jgi:hypothetical protein
MIVLSEVSSGWSGHFLKRFLFSPEYENFKINKGMWAGHFLKRFLFSPEYENLKINKGMCIDHIFSYSSPSSLLS